MWGDGIGESFSKIVNKERALEAFLLDSAARAAKHEYADDGRHHENDAAVSRVHQHVEEAIDIVHRQSPSFCSLTITLDAR